jgi:serine phosphatase RsbU (regulator of sigma subunit)/CHASE2 domain-containing sensor protein
MTDLSLTSEGHADRRIRLFGLAAALAMAGLLGLVGSDRVSRPIFDQWQRLNPRPAEPTRVEIVWIDEASIRTIGPWPWPRYIMAKLVAKLEEDEPRLIGLDMLFPEADRNSPDAFVRLYPELSAPTAAEIRAMPSMDSLFGQVIGQAPVVMGRGGLDVTPVKDPPVMAVEARFSRPLPLGVKSWGQAIANIPELDDVGFGHGLLNGDPDSDGIVRHVPLAAMVAGQAMPGFALELARIAFGIEILEPVANGDRLAGIRLGRTWLPTLPDGRMRVPYRAATRRPALSALDILYDLPPSERVKGKIVIIGLSGAGTADVVSTPLSEKTYGAVVHADALEAMLEGRTLARPGWARLSEGLLSIMLVGVAIGVLPLFRGAGAALGAAGVIVLTFGGSWAAFRQGMLIDPVGPVLTAAAAGMTMLVLLFAKARHDRFALAASLQEQRLGAARAAGELSAARDIQLGMLPRRDTLAGFDPAVELDALIEPARSIGGDFYDTIRLDNDRVCFLVGDVTGKGVPAALFMALSKALAKSVLLRDGNDLAAAMTRLNDEIARDNGEDMFVTMLVGLLNTRTGALELCNAGHENPWLVTAQGEICHLNPEGGPPLSVAPGYVYNCESVTMNKGDALVIVSDGITEAQNPAGGFFGTARIAKVLRACAGTVEISDMSETLLAEVRAFEDGADATDDLTVLAFRYLT